MMMETRGSANSKAEDGPTVKKSFSRRHTNFSAKTGSKLKSMSGLVH